MQCFFSPRRACFGQISGIRDHRTRNLLEDVLIGGRASPLTFNTSQYEVLQVAVLGREKETKGCGYLSVKSNHLSNCSLFERYLSIHGLYDSNGQHSLQTSLRQFVYAEYVKDCLLNKFIFILTLYLCDYSTMWPAHFRKIISCDGCLPLITPCRLEKLIRCNIYGPLPWPFLKVSTYSKATWPRCPTHFLS